MTCMVDIRNSVERYVANLCQRIYTASAIVSGLPHFISKWRLQTLIASTPLIEGFEHPITNRTDIRVVRRKRSICARVEHLWMLESMEGGIGNEISRYTVRCSRCFPHIDSQTVISSYNPFPYDEPVETMKPELVKE